MGVSPFHTNYGQVKPPLGTPISRTHPLAQGMSDCLLFAEGAGTRYANSAAAFGATAAGAPAWKPGGLSVSGGASANIPQHANYAAGDFSVRVIHTPASYSGGYTALFDKGVSNSSRELSVFLDTGGNVSYLDVGGTGMSPILPTSMATGKVWDFVLTRKGTACTAYVNRAAAGTFVNAGVLACPTLLCLGGNPSTGGSNYAGVYSLVQIWQSRALSAAEVASLYVAPYQMFGQGVSRFYSIASGIVFLRPLFGRTIGDI